MSNKKERNDLEFRLSEVTERLEKELEDIKEVAIAVEELAQNDGDKACDCSGAVAEMLEGSVEKLEQVAEVINNGVEEIEMALGDIQYAFNDF